jgi:hypothetical protein
MGHHQVNHKLSVHISKKTLSPNGSVVLSLTYGKCLPFTIQLLFNVLIYNFILGFPVYHKVEIIAFKIIIIQ